MIDANYITKFKTALQKQNSNITPQVIVDHLLYCLLEKKKHSDMFRFINPLFKKDNDLHLFLTHSLCCDFTLPDIIFIYEGLLDPAQKKEKGITFTPLFIAKYICEYAIRHVENKIGIKVIDPSCGGGIFLLQALDLLKKKVAISTRRIIEEYLFGIDLLSDNVLVTKKILVAQCILDGDDPSGMVLNIRCEDSLKCDWRALWNVDFDAVVGNPPYVNPHDLPQETIKLLKKNFQTAGYGTTNIFYAFVEKGISYVNKTGCLCYIVPNNFITINAASAFRSFLTSNQYISYLIDFTDNMLFSPTRTYNAIIALDRKPKISLQYSKVSATPIDELKEKINELPKNDIQYKYLDDEHSWALLTPQEKKNIDAIEGQWISIKQYIKTGIATLKDDCYLIDYCHEGKFIKKAGTQIFEIEPGIVRPIYKVSEIDPNFPIELSKKYIIFPYEKGPNGKQCILAEEKLMSIYPQAYNYLLSQKLILSQRDKGKENPAAWFAYGRTQGINFVGEKILYPTFSNVPKFQLIHDAMSLFCNGYAIFETDYLSLNILQKILNSSIMKYYISLTSYPIEGGYMCYQKKYIERFSIPLFTQEEQHFLEKCLTPEKIDAFLQKKYGLVMI